MARTLESVKPFFVQTEARKLLLSSGFNFWLEKATLQQSWALGFWLEAEAEGGGRDGRHMGEKHMARRRVGRKLPD